MNLATPAPEVEEARAAPAKSESIRRNEYVVRDAENTDEAMADKAMYVEPAVVIKDPKQFAPMKYLNQRHRDESLDVPISKLRSQGILFEGPAAVTSGMITTNYRKFQIFLSKCLPYGKYLYDERDFVSYGELLRYVVVKDETLLVYTEESASNPIYTIPIDSSLHAVKERHDKPHPRSLTISPMTNSNMQAADLQTVLLLDARNRLVQQCTFHCATTTSKNHSHNIADDFIRAIQHVNKIVKKSEM